MRSIITIIVSGLLTGWLISTFQDAPDPPDHTLSDQSNRAIAEATEAGPTFQVLQPLNAVRLFGVLAYLRMAKPATMSVAEWVPGAFAEYEFEQLSDSPSQTGYKLEPTVTWEILDVCASTSKHVEQFGSLGDTGYWIKVHGAGGSRNHRGDLYRLVAKTQLQPSAQSSEYKFVDGYIPLRNPMSGLFPKASVFDDVEWREMEPETIDSPAGRFECSKFTLWLDGDDLGGEIWTCKSPETGIFGVVKVATEYESLTLSKIGLRTPSEIAEPLIPVIEGSQTLSNGCSSCHRKDSEGRMIALGPMERD